VDENRSHAKAWDRATLRDALLREFDAESLDRDVWPLITRWFDRGDGCAVYENQDLCSRDLGHQQFVSYGSPSAQLETPEPPVQMPDIGRSINWRYRLVAVCKD